MILCIYCHSEAESENQEMKLFAMCRLSAPMLPMMAGAMAEDRPGKKSPTRAALTNQLISLPDEHGQLVR